MLDSDNQFIPSSYKSNGSNHGFLFAFQMRRGFEIFPKFHLTCICKVITGALLKRGNKMGWKFWVQGYLLNSQSSAQTPHFQTGWHPWWRLRWLSWWRTWRGACECNFEYSAVFCWEEMKHFWIANLLKHILFYIYTFLLRWHRVPIKH